MLDPARVLLFLERFPKKGVRLLRDLFQSARRSELRAFDETVLINEGLTDLMIETLLLAEADTFKERIYRWRQGKIAVLTLFDEHYPWLLKTIPDPPVVLYLKGSLEKLPTRSIGIVGARHADRNGIELSQQFGELCTKNGICVVSGLALGIDGAAHIGALKGRNAPTVAVLGSGVEVCYPPSHQKIYEDILSSGGAILSEYEPGTPAYPTNFLERNRIIAGMAELLLVVQAAKRSGSLRTALAAIEYGRDVGVIPWDIFNKRGEGCNALLKKGATPITSHEDVLSFFNITPEVAQSSGQSILSEIEKRVLSLFHFEKAIHIDEIRTKVPACELAITNLELLGLLKRSHGNIMSQAG